MNIADILNTGCFVENDYFKAYINLIEDNIFTTCKIKGKTQLHHIIPRIYFKNRGIACDDSPNNTVNLLYKDHLLAHYYLSLCASNNYYTYCFSNAFMYMFNKRENIYFNIEDLDKYQEIYENLCHAKSIHQKGQGLGNKKSIETRNKMSVAARSTLLIYKGDIRRRVPKIELHTFLDDGWVIGKGPLPDCVKKKISESHKGKIINDETRKKISETLKGNIPWNKGKKYDEELKKKCFGKTWLDAQFKSGHVPWNKGKSFSEDVRKKMSESAKKRKPTVLGRKIMYNKHTDIQVFVEEKDFEYYISQGFIFGKRPISEEHRKHLSEAAKIREKAKKGELND